MKYGIDFDGVLCERYSIPTKGKFVDCPSTEDAVEAVKALRHAGHELYIFTNRQKKDWKAIEKWLKEQGFPKLRITNQKESKTTVYLDDRAVRFSNWKDFCKLYL